MGEPKKQATLGLGDTNVDPDILTKEVDHDFFDNPLGSQGDIEEILRCQEGEKDNNVEKILNTRPNGGLETELCTLSVSPSMRTSSEPNCSLIGTRLEKEEMLIMGKMEGTIGQGGDCVDSGRSSSNITVQLELGKDGMLEQVDGNDPAADEDFYSMQSNANYPRPKESYQLQQRRRSFGTIQQPPQAGSCSKKQGQNFHPMNSTDCGLNGHFNDLTSSDSSNSGSSSDDNNQVDGQDESDSDLSDSSESELESLATDDEEFVDMLEKYFEYIEPESDYSDLTEVSPLSSVAASPLPPSFYSGIDISSEYTQQSDQLNIMTDAKLCAAASALTICDADDEGDTGDTEDDDREEVINGKGFSGSTEIDVAVAAVTAVASAVPAVAQLIERDLKMRGKPRLPMVISTTETVIIPGDESDDDNNAPGSLSMSASGTCGTSIDDANLDDDFLQAESGTSEEDGRKMNGEFGEKDPATGKKELDVCFNCCVMEHAKKILSREASPSRKNGWLGAGTKQGDEEGNGNTGGNGNDEMGRGAFGAGASRARCTWNGKVRAGSSTSATSSSSSNTTTGSSSSKFGSSASSGGGSTGLRRTQRNFTFSPEQMRKIERENHILLRKILDTHQKGYHGGHGTHCHTHRCRNGHHHHHSGHQNRTASSSTSIARLRQQKRIDHENSILMKKLQNVKPSRDIGDAFGKAAVKN